MKRILLAFVFAAVFCAADAQTRLASSFGWNATNATAALQAAIDSGAGKIVIDRQEGDWLVDPVYLRRSNQEIVLADGVAVRARKGSFKGRNDCLFTIPVSVSNLVLRGEGHATLAMEKKDYQNKKKYSFSEWRHALAINGAKDVTVRDLDILSSGGDGIYVSKKAKNIRIDRVNCRDHHRQGISVISALGLKVTRCRFDGTRGTLPACGIDIEPNGPYDWLQDILFEDCSFCENQVSGIFFDIEKLDGTTPPVSIVFRRCRADGNARSGIEAKCLAKGAAGSELAGYVKFEDCSVAGNGRTAVSLTRKNPERVAISFENCMFDAKGCRDGAIRLDNVRVRSDFGNVSFSGVRIAKGDGPLFSYYSALGYGIAPGTVTGTAVVDYGDGRTGEIRIEDFAKDYYPGGAKRGGANPPAVLSPKEGEEVPLLSDGQKAFLDLSHEERLTYFDGSVPGKGESLKKLGWLPLPVTLKWEGGVPPYEVTVRKAGADRDWPVEHVSTNNFAEVWNCEIAAEYEWFVCGADGSVVHSHFRTEDRAPRLIRIPGESKKLMGVPNMRDLGGRVMRDGRRIRQGLVYRSSGLNNNAPVKYYTLDEILALEKEGKLEKLGETGAKYSERLKAGKKLDAKHLRLVKEQPKKPGTPRLSTRWRKYLVRTLGIKTDIDLRSRRERFGMKESPLGHGVKFVCDWENYDGYSAVQDKGLEATRKVFKTLANKKNYPLVFHCIGGADRTGTVATLLLGILGASDDDIWREYQITAWRGTVGDKRHLNFFTGLVKSFDGFEGETLSDRIRSYFREKCGFSEKQLDAIREILLEPAATPEKP